MLKPGKVYYWQYQGLNNFVETADFLVNMEMGKAVKQYPHEWGTSYLCRENGNKSYIVLLETGDEPRFTHHYVLCPSQEHYIGFIRNYACLFHVFNEVIENYIAVADVHEEARQRAYRGE